MNCWKYSLPLLLFACACSSGKKSIQETELVAHTARQLNYALELAVP